MSIVPVVLLPRETPVKPRFEPTCCQLALPVAATVGNRGAPAMRTWASAWRTRAIAAAMSKFCTRACSIRSDSSGERKPRHQSSDGQASAAVPSVARNATGISTCGRT